MKRLMVAASLLAAAAVVHADPVAPTNRVDHSRVGATVGLFTPTGELGLEYTQVLHASFEVGVGAGVGVVRVGPQVSVMPRVRASLGPLTFTGGAGLSVGEYNNISPFADENAPRIPSLFGNVEAGLQYTSSRGPFVRAFLGAGRILAHGAFDETNASYRAELQDVIPFGGVTAGWAF